MIDNLKFKTMTTYKIIFSAVILMFHYTPLFPKSLDSENQLKSKYGPNDTLKVLDYAFKDLLNNDVRLSDFKGKYILIDIWYTGCGGCITCNEALKSVHKSLKSENVAFLSISIDRNKQQWMQSITKDAIKTALNPWAGKYYPLSGTVTLYTGGSGYDNEFIKKYVPNNVYPKLMLIDPEGKLISQNLPRPDFDADKLTEVVKQAMKANEK